MKNVINVRARLCCLIVILSIAGVAQAQNLAGLLPINEAYKLTVSANTSGIIKLHWAIAPGYYLYRGQMRFIGGEGVTLGVPQLPGGKKYHDEYLGNVETYHDSIDASIPYTLAPGTQRIKISVRYQGCHEVEPKICYPPHTEAFDLPLPGGATTGQGGNSGNSGKARVSGILASAGALPKQSHEASDAVSKSIGPGSSPSSKARANLHRAEVLANTKKPMQAVQAFVAAIDAAPDFLEAHRALLKFEQDEKLARLGKDPSPQDKKISSIIEKKYAEWERRYPGSCVIQLSIGERRFHLTEDPESEKYLLKYLELDSGNEKAHAQAHARVYAMLADLSAFRGDVEAQRKYLHKASSLEPKSADYALRYARSLDSDAALLDVMRRFSGTQTAAWAFADVCDRALDDTKRRVMFERLLARFPPAKYDASVFGAFHLYDVYLRVDPAKALKLTQQIQVARAGHQFGSWDWAKLRKLVQVYLEAEHLMDAGDASKAVGLLDALANRRFPPTSPTGAMLARFKAQVLTGAGKLDEAYKELVHQQASAPGDETRVALQHTGALLHKTPGQIEADLRTALFQTHAKTAPLFELKEYGSERSVSLAKLRGKVVFITFWFPGCGPCRAELPHLESVLRQFPKTDVAFLGINIDRAQDSLVLPFMTNGRHIFTPLQGTKPVVASYDSLGIAPWNALIDKEGRIVYSGFMIKNAHDEQILRNMIKSLL